MSVFQVQLQNTVQGQLDRDYSSAGWAMTANGATPGTPFTTSPQRQVYIMGPKRNQMLLNDGATFTGSNYFKRFCYPQVSLEEAILVCTTDDGSVYSDFDPAENTSVAGKTVNVAKGSTLATSGNTVDVVSLFGAPATFTQISVGGVAGDSIGIELNGNVDALITLPAGSVQIFNSGDIVITKIRLKDVATAGAGPTPVQLVFGVTTPDMVSGVTGNIFPLGPGHGLK